MDEIIKNYLNLEVKMYNSLKLITFEPMPTEQDYVYQYIFRYFVRKRNESNGLIYEVNKITYNTFKQDSLYFGVRIKWKIYGDRNETEQMNKNSVIYGKKIISNLDTYMTDYLKFWKG